MTASVVDELESDTSPGECPVPEEVRSHQHLAALAHLERERTATVSELAAVVADERSAERDVEGQYLVETALALHEEVLPDLAAAGLVDYERTGEEVTVGFLSAAVADWLGSTAEPSAANG